MISAVAIWVHDHIAAVISCAGIAATRPDKLQALALRHPSQSGLTDLFCGIHGKEAYPKVIWKPLQKITWKQCLATHYVERPVAVPPLEGWPTMLDNFTWRRVIGTL